MAEDIMRDVYRGIIKQGQGLLDAGFTGYKIRQELEERKAKMALEQRAQEIAAEKNAIDLAKMDLTWKAHQEDLNEKTLDRLQRGEIAGTTQGLKGLELQLKEKELATKADLERQNIGIKLLNTQMRAKEFEVKVKELGNKAVSTTVAPLIQRLRVKAAEANNLRNKVYTTTGFSLPEREKAQAELQLNQAMVEIDNLASTIDRLTIGTGGTDGEGSMVPGQDLAQKTRDERIANINYKMHKLGVVANVGVNTRDPNPQVQAIKEQAAAPIISLRNKTIARIQDLQDRYYKQLETDPMAPSPEGKIKALLYDMKVKIDAMKSRNRYLQTVVQDKGLNDYLYDRGGQQ